MLVEVSRGTLGATSLFLKYVRIQRWLIVLDDHNSAGAKHVTAMTKSCQNKAEIV